MISSLNDPILNCVGSLSPSSITTCTIEMTGFTIYQKQKISTCPIIQTILATSIDRNKYLNKNTPGVKKERPITKKGLLKKMLNQNGWPRPPGFDRIKNFDHNLTAKHCYLGAQGLLMLMGSKFLIKMTRQQNKGHDDQNFIPIKSKRPWPPILISHLFQQGLFSSWLLLFYTWGVFV